MFVCVFELLMKFFKTFFISVLFYSGNIPSGLCVVDGSSAQTSHTCLVIQRMSDKEGGCHCPLGSFVITDDTHRKEYYNKVMFFIA